MMKGIIYILETKNNTQETKNNNLKEEEIQLVKKLRKPLWIKYIMGMIISFGIIIAGVVNKSDKLVTIAIVFTIVYGTYCVAEVMKAKEQLEEWRRYGKNIKNHTSK